MVLRWLLSALAAFGAGFGVLRVSVAFESYALLTAAMLLLIGGAGLLFRSPRAAPMVA